MDREERGRLLLIAIITILAAIGAYFTLCEMVYQDQMLHNAIEYNGVGGF